MNMKEQLSSIQSKGKADKSFSVVKILVSPSFKKLWINFVKKYSKQGFVSVTLFINKFHKRWGLLILKVAKLSFLVGRSQLVAWETMWQKINLKKNWIFASGFYKV